MMKDQKTMRAKIESLEFELSKGKLANSPVVEGSPELRRKTIAPGSAALNSTGLASNGSYLAAASAGATPGANISADRLLSHGKQRAVSVYAKPLPAPPGANGGTVKNAPKLGTTRLNIDAAAVGSQSGNGAKNSPSPRSEDEYPFINYL